MKSQQQRATKKYLSELTISERVSDCKDAAKDVVDTCDSFAKLMSRVQIKSKEIERQLRLTDVDVHDPYDPIAKSIRLIEEIINETD